MQAKEGEMDFYAATELFICLHLVLVPRSLSLSYIRPLHPHSTAMGTRWH